MTRLWFATIVCIIGFGLIVQAGIAQADLTDLLYEKGQISKEEWLKEKADREKMGASGYPVGRVRASYGRPRRNRPCKTPRAISTCWGCSRRGP